MHMSSIKQERHRERIGQVRQDEADMWFRLTQIVQVDESGSVIGGDGRGDAVPSRE